jgi:hypothetical protein
MNGERHIDQAISDGIESAWCWGNCTGQNVATNAIGCFACQVIAPFFLGH